MPDVQAATVVQQLVHQIVDLITQVRLLAVAMFLIFVKSTWQSVDMSSGHSSKKNIREHLKGSSCLK